MGQKKRVILVTDGDGIAQAAVERAAKNVGGRTISLSAGNPTPLSGREIVQEIQKASDDPVLVMVDDKGTRNKGAGERALEEIAKSPGIQILGVIAVASNTKKVEGVPVDVSIDREGRIVPRPVDKWGKPEKPGRAKVEGDTVDILNRLDIPIVVGMGDPGKMGDADAVTKGAPITTRAVRYILENSPVVDGRENSSGG
ncbi:MAG: stage V sporulation protein AE [Syntrophothermus sp.]